MNGKSSVFSHFSAERVAVLETASRPSARNGVVDLRDRCGRERRGIEAGRIWNQTECRIITASYREFALDLVTVEAGACEYVSIEPGNRPSLQSTSAP